MLKLTAMDFIVGGAIGMAFSAFLFSALLWYVAFSSPTEATPEARIEYTIDPALNQIIEDLHKKPEVHR
jgi:hypothetical protein